MGLERIEAVFAKHKNGDAAIPLLNIYLTAGYPRLDSTKEILLALDAAGVDFIELGLPYSDPLADGPTIQNSSAKAIANGISLSLIFEQVAEVKEQVSAPIIAMGYYNQLLQFGIAHFLDRCVAVGIDGLIIPDLPLDIYHKEIEALLIERNLGFSFLVTPRTSAERVILLDKATRGFIYVVSSSSTTGTGHRGIYGQSAFFERLAAMELTQPKLIGFNISDAESLAFAGKYAAGGIIGSAFIRALDEDNILDSVAEFIGRVRGSNR